MKCRFHISGPHENCDLIAGFEYICPSREELTLSTRNKRARILRIIEATFLALLMLVVSATHITEDNGKTSIRRVCFDKKIMS